MFQKATPEGQCCSVLILPFMLLTKVKWIRLGTPATVVNKSIIKRRWINLALKMWSRDVISPIQCLTSLKTWQSCDVIEAPSVQPAFVYFSRVPPALFNWLWLLPDFFRHRNFAHQGYEPGSSRFKEITEKTHHQVFFTVSRFGEKARLCIYHYEQVGLEPSSFELTWRSQAN